MDLHRLGGGAKDSAGRRCGVSIVPADRNTDVVQSRQDSIGGIKRLPADLRNIKFDPGMGCG